jgi:hypothetical protein
VLKPPRKTHARVVVFPSTKRQSFPRWRAALDHPTTKTAVIAFQLTAISIATGSATLAFQNLSQAQRLAAYQLVATEAAPAAAKWPAINAVLASDGSIQGPSLGCAFPDTGPPRAPLCETVQNVEISGPSFKRPYSIVALDMHSTGFSSGRLQNVVFKGGNLRRAEIKGTELNNVRFEGTSMFGLLIDTRGQATPTDVIIEQSAMWLAHIKGDDLGGVSIRYSDVSSLFVSTPGALPSFRSNYIRKGSKPPMVNNVERPDLVVYECDVPEGVVNIVPIAYPGCRHL